jgi:uncharacterized membrane protein
MLPTTAQLDDQIRDDPLLALLPGIITAGTLLVAFTLLAAGFDHFWIAFPLGFGGVLPVAIGYRVYADTTAHQPSVRSASDEEDALETLKQQYARGELSDRCRTVA